MAEFRVITQGERNEAYVDGKEASLRRYLMPFFGERAVSEISAGLIQEYRMHRLNPPAMPPTKAGVKGRAPAKVTKRPSRSTLHKEIVALRQVLKTANRKGWIAGLPDMTAPYKANGKVTHRAWFSPEEYRRLYEATRERARNPKNERWRGECEQFHDYVRFMVNTGLRPDEASRLPHIGMSSSWSMTTLASESCRSRCGANAAVGYCKSMLGA